LLWYKKATNALLNDTLEQLATYSNNRFISYMCNYIYTVFYLLTVGPY